MDEQDTLPRVIKHPLDSLAASISAVIRIDAIWLSREPLDMRTGSDTALARVLSDVLERLPTAKQSDLNGLLHHNLHTADKA